MATVAAPVERLEGRFERLCWERHARDLALAHPLGVGDKPWETTQHPKGFWFDEAAADRVCEFIETLCRHHKGEWAGRPLLLEPWQRRILAIAFGWMRANGSRRFRILYIEVPRKNGKSEIAAALGLFLLAADQEPGAEVYSSATKKDQAKIVHDTAGAMVKASPELRRFIRAFRNNLNCPRIGSKFEPLGADSSTLDGLNPHGNIVDELHAHKDRKVWDVMVTGMGARRQPMTVAITTAGVFAPESIGWLQHEHAIKVLEQSIEDDAFFSFIACADPTDDPYDPATWEKANPNFGVSVKPDYMAEQAHTAEVQPSFLNTFLRLHLNVWTEQVNRWIPIDKWNASDVKDGTPAIRLAREKALLGKLCRGGLDLSQKIDISALVLVFPDTWDLVCRFWCPEERIIERSRRDRVPYDAWRRDGWMIATPGPTIDQDFIKADVLRLTKAYDIQEIGYDPYCATQLATSLTNEGLTMVEVRQGYKSMSEASKDFEAKIVAKLLKHAGNPVLRWMVSNVSTRRDVNENIMPDKDASTDRIDGVTATIIALSRIIGSDDGPSIYDTQELFLV